VNIHWKKTRSCLLSNWSVYTAKEDKLLLKLKHTNSHFQIRTCPSYFQKAESEATPFFKH